MGIQEMVKLSLFLIKHLAIKMEGGTEVQLHSFITSVLDKASARYEALQNSSLKKSLTG
jgi:hypothetical protein